MIKDINIFFNRLRLDDGAIWIDNGNIRLSTSKKLKNEETKKLITDHKIKIISILNENQIFSKEQFLNRIIFRDTVSAHYPLSPAQERLWFIEQFEQGTNAYHVPTVFELDTKTNRNGIAYALQQIVSRHEVLRTTIEQVENQDHAIQVVHEDQLLIESVKIGSVQDYKTLLKEDINRPFNLSREYPLRAKFYILHQGKAGTSQPLKRFFLLINIHHIATDGWSMEIFEKELLGYYKAFINNDRHFYLPAPEIQYKDYAIWQRAFLTGPLLEKQLHYWKNKLSGYEPLKMPTDFARPTRVNYEGKHIKFAIKKKTSRQLRALAMQNGTTLHSVMLSTINVLFSKYTGQDDIVTGSVIANRHHPQTEGLIGFFVNTLVNRTRLHPAQSFVNLIQQVHQDQAEAQHYQDLPFEKLVESLEADRDLSMHPVFQVMFGVESFGNKREIQDQQKTYHKPQEEAMAYKVEKFDITITIDDSNPDLEGHISYATSLFRRETIKLLIHRYMYLLDQLTGFADLPLSQFGLIDAKEYKQTIYLWNSTEKKYSGQKTICSVFRKKAAKKAGHIALLYGGEYLSYQELEEKSNQLARHIRKQYLLKTNQSLSAGTPVAIILQTGMEMVIGILAVLKSGGAYVPIHPDYPPTRVRYILEDTNAALVLSLREMVAGNQSGIPEDRCIDINLSEKFYFEEDNSGFPSYAVPTSLAYLIYTSGSTGKPKAVAIQHQSVVNMLTDRVAEYKMSVKENALLTASISFDASVEQIFVPLLSGATLILVDREILADTEKCEQFLNKNKITHIDAVPSFLESLDFSKLIYLKRVVAGGESCYNELVRRILPYADFYNEYGPTEATVMVTQYKITKGTDFSNSIPIGTPIRNAKIFILDAHLNLVPPGITGEICIGGECLARGYFNREVLTAEKFIPNPFDDGRLYKTGDLGRWRYDGQLEYIGRNDNQVKIRGYRIELAEIEQALSQISGIRQCIVLAKENKTVSGTHHYLAAYYILNNTAKPLPPAIISDILSAVLPGYMVPDILVEMKSFPVNANGKLDKQALPGHSDKPAKGYVAPKNETEKAICAIWKKALGVKRVGLTDNFFMLGGNSIIAIQVSYQMSRTLGNKILVADLFRLKSIDKILGAIIKNFQLVNAYHDVPNSRLPNIIFIHPGHGGAEVYQHLADQLSVAFNGIGIDNYNIHHSQKIGCLNTLAYYYLSEFEKKFTISEPVTLLGWSLGGQIALEMAAILEMNGFKNIKVYLLDTFIHGGMMLGAGGQKETHPAAKNRKMRAKYLSVYFDKVAAASDAELELFNASISCRLKYTDVTLFKACQSGIPEDEKNPEAIFLEEQLKLLSANNINLVADKLNVINLNCNHTGILETNGVNIGNYILANLEQ
jgi:amino acid adenylation domain-containing protein